MKTRHIKKLLEMLLEYIITESKSEIVYGLCHEAECLYHYDLLSLNEKGLSRKECNLLGTYIKENMPVLYYVGGGLGKMSFEKLPQQYRDKNHLPLGKSDWGWQEDQNKERIDWIKEQINTFE